MRCLARIAEHPLQSISLASRMRCLVRIAEHLSSQRISLLAAVQSGSRLRDALNGSWLRDEYLCKQRISQPAAVKQQAA